MRPQVPILPGGRPIPSPGRRAVRTLQWDRRAGSGQAAVGVGGSQRRARSQRRTAGRHHGAHRRRPFRARYAERWAAVRRAAHPSSWRAAERRRRRVLHSGRGRWCWRGRNRRRGCVCYRSRSRSRESGGRGRDGGRNCLCNRARASARCSPRFVACARARAWGDAIRVLDVLTSNPKQP